MEELQENIHLQVSASLEEMLQWAATSMYCHVCLFKQENGTQTLNVYCNVYVECMKWGKSTCNYKAMASFFTVIYKCMGIVNFGSPSIYVVFWLICSYCNFCLLKLFQYLHHFFLLLLLPLFQIRQLLLYVDTLTNIFKSFFFF